MTVDKVREISQDRTVWRFVVFAYLAGNKEYVFIHIMLALILRAHPLHLPISL